jgi:hypothetical protein
MLKVFLLGRSSTSSLPASNNMVLSVKLDRQLPSSQYSSLKQNTIALPSLLGHLPNTGKKIKA